MGSPEMARGAAGGGHGHKATGQPQTFPGPGVQRCLACLDLHIDLLENHCLGPVVAVSHWILGKLKYISTTVLAKNSSGAVVMLAKLIICFDSLRQSVQSAYLFGWLVFCSLFVFQIEHEQISTFLKYFQHKAFASNFSFFFFFLQLHYEPDYDELSSFQTGSVFNNLQ